MTEPSPKPKLVAEQPPASSDQAASSAADKPLFSPPPMQMIALGDDPGSTDRTNLDH